ncbi:hypothetical protein [Tuwongella immobilis]|uniref:Uncharacterized protein n=1 Tax=Tuwongella immobilis TaxID=692036 RepID=A0A6C2YQ24_9BACT|nr:hypothetical protein [Tuwongella immobilis]VIP03494.1 unnamed protein product [Tuwongella immobilis]VTS04357.1 unnamed protein product [Tuwongella immobilis]
MRQLSLYGTILRNLGLYTEAQKVGFEYVLNPNSGELHIVSTDGFWGSHNLAFADLGSFIGLTNVGEIPAHMFLDGMELPVWDLLTGEQVGMYRLNKCRHCFPNAAEPGTAADGGGM